MKLRKCATTLKSERRTYQWSLTMGTTMTLLRGNVRQTHTTKFIEDEYYCDRMPVCPSLPQFAPVCPSLPQFAPVCPSLPSVPAVPVFQFPRFYTRGVRECLRRALLRFLYMSSGLGGFQVSIKGSPLQLSKGWFLSRLQYKPGLLRKPCKFFMLSLKLEAYSLLLMNLTELF